MGSYDLLEKNWFLWLHKTFHVQYAGEKIKFFQKLFLMHPTTLKPFPMNFSTQITLSYTEFSGQT